MVPAAEFARRRREGLEIFAGVGAKRLTDFIGEKRSIAFTAAKAKAPLPHVPTLPVKNGRIKRPLPLAAPQALPPSKYSKTASSRSMRVAK
jgi:hypothetical protein